MSRAKIIEAEFAKFRHKLGKALGLKGILGEEIPPAEFILAEIDRLTAENEKLKKQSNTVTCLWCAHKFAVDRTSENGRIMFLGQMAEHLLVCTNHPLTRRIGTLIAENKAKDEQIEKREHDAAMLCGEIARLTAEKKRLRDDTDCETESGGILCIEQADQIERLTQQLAKASEQNYCMSCGTTLDGYVPPEQAELTPDEIKRAEGIVAACDGDVTLAGAIEIIQRNTIRRSRRMIGP